MTTQQATCGHDRPGNRSTLAKCGAQPRKTASEPPRGSRQPTFRPFRPCLACWNGARSPSEVGIRGISVDIDAGRQTGDLACISCSLVAISLPALRWPRPLPSSVPGIARRRRAARDDQAAPGEDSEHMPGTTIYLTHRRQGSNCLDQAREQRLISAPMPIGILQRSFGRSGVTLSHGGWENA
jgi:hypothetical protein